MSAFAQDFSFGSSGPSLDLLDISRVPISLNNGFAENLLDYANRRRYNEKRLTDTVRNVMN
jgi:hypothetical protein